MKAAKAEKPMKAMKRAAMTAAKAPARPKPMKATKNAMKVAKKGAMRILDILKNAAMKAAKKATKIPQTADEFSNNAMLKGMLIKIRTENVTEVLVNVWTEGKEIKYKWYLCYKR